MSDIRRELGVKLSYSKLEEVDGGLLVRDVKLLAEGTWTDSAVRTPLFYPARTLEKFATNWNDRTGWSRHLGRDPRSITDKVSEAMNIRYHDRAIVADVFLHGKTQASRDTIELVKSGLAQYVSVEHSGVEKINPDTKRLEADSLEFYGYAHVNRGACALCRLDEDGSGSGSSEGEGTGMELKELEEKFAAQAKELEAAKKIAADAVVALEDVKKSNKELSENLAKAGESLKVLGAMEERIKKLESIPLGAKGQIASEERELELPNINTVTDPVTGNTYRRV